MLPKKNRLKKKKEFEMVFREGRSFQGCFFILKIKENHLSFPRFAFVFPVKNEKSAERRNRGKRVFREAVRGFLPFISTGNDIIFIIKKEANEREYQEIREDIERSLEKIKILTGDQRELRNTDRKLQ